MHRFEDEGDVIIPFRMLGKGKDESLAHQNLTRQG